MNLPITSCQRFVHPSEYAMVMTIAQNPAFVTAEDGSLYAYVGTGGFGYSEVNGTVTCSSVLPDPSGRGYVTQGCFVTTDALFDLFSPTETVSGCGITEPKNLGEIDVAIPVNATGGLNLSNLSVSKVPSDELNIFTCTVQSTFSPTVSLTNSTTTITTALNVTSVLSSTSLQAGQASAQPQTDGRSNPGFLPALGTIVVAASVVALAVIYSLRSRKLHSWLLRR